MLADLISSKTRIKLLLRFFLNSSTRSYLRGLAEEFGESTNAVRVELNRLEDAGLLTAHAESNKKYYQANTKHPLYSDIHEIVKKHLGIDQIVMNIAQRLGDIRYAYLTGPFATGQDCQIIDVVLVGELELVYLSELIHRVEKLISRRIRYLHFTIEQWTKEEQLPFEGQLLLIWDKENQPK